MVITYFESLAQKILNGELSGYFLTRNGLRVESWHLHQNKIGDNISEYYPYVIMDGDLKGTTITSEGKYAFNSSFDSEFDLVEFFQYAETNKQKNMETENERTVKLTLEKACEWYQKGGELKDVALQAYTEEEINKHLNAHKHPTSWEEYVNKTKKYEMGYFIDANTDIRACNWCFCDRNIPDTWRNVLPSKELAEAFLAMMQLMSLRQAWIGDWNGVNVEDAVRWGVCYDPGFDSIELEYSCIINFPLSFPTKEMAEEFMKCFKDLLEIAKPLL